MWMERCAVWLLQFSSQTSLAGEFKTFWLTYCISA